MIELPEEVAPLTRDELEALPVFPLPRLVFFPGSTLPLHIFEPRYRAMMEDCIAHGPMAMAVSMIAEDGEEDESPPLQTIAGAGRIIDWRRRRDGRFDLLLYGLTRVRLEELPREDRAYRRARAESLPDRLPHLDAIERHLTPLLGTAATVVALVRERYPDFSLGVEAATPPTVIADRIADRLVADPEARQRLLEATDVKVRLALVHDALVDLMATLRSQGLGGALH
jgi:Lon protease-like protein